MTDVIWDVTPTKHGSRMIGGFQKSELHVIVAYYTKTDLFVLRY